MSARWRRLAVKGAGAAAGVSLTAYLFAGDDSVKQVSDSLPGPALIVCLTFNYYYFVCKKQLNDLFVRFFLHIKLQQLIVRQKMPDWNYKSAQWDYVTAYQYVLVMVSLYLRYQGSYKRIPDARECTRRQPLLCPYSYSLPPLQAQPTLISGNSESIMIPED